MTYVSLGTFLLDLRVGERLSYGMALALVVVAQSIATAGMIPVSNERLWIDKFIGWSFYWVIVGLVESVGVGYLYFLREDATLSLATDNPTIDVEERRNQFYEGVGESIYLPNKKMTSDDGDDNNNQEPKEVQQTQLSSVQEYAENGVPSAPEDFGDDVSASKSDPESINEHLSTFKQQMQKRKLAAEESASRFASAAGESAARIENKGLFGKKCWTWMYTISLRKMDRFFFFFTLITYTMYVIAMFISVPYWGSRFKSPWNDENTERPE